MKKSREKRKISKIIIILGILSISVLVYLFFSVHKNEVRKVSWNGTYTINKEEIPEEFIVLSNEETNIFENKYEIEIETLNLKNENTYVAKIIVDSETKKELELKNENIKYDLVFEEEGKKEIQIQILKNSEEVYETSKEIVYIKTYQKQYLEELSETGVSTHFLPGYDDFEQSFDLLKNLGAKTIRNSITWEQIENSKREYNFSTINIWKEKIKENNINVLTILLSSVKSKIGDDFRISTNEELQAFKNYVKNINLEYPDIKEYEIWNEPNINWKTEEAMEWYAKMVKEVKDVAKDSEVIAGSTAVPQDINSPTILSETFLSEISKNGAYKYSDAFSYHIYSFENGADWLRRTNTSHKQLVNSLGGFQKLYITEYGMKTGIQNIDENEVASRTVKQTIISQSQGIDKIILYNLVDDSENVKYGLLNKDYTPKKSYFAMKNYYQNINGTEFIGRINLADGVESYVYNKEGKPLIVAWTNSGTKTINANNNDYKILDVYGNEKLNNNEIIEINTSPIYIKNISNIYFYNSIANVLMQKYTEFEENFTEQITKVSSLHEKIQNMKNSNLEIIEGISEDLAKEIMEANYSMGNDILQAYSDGELEETDTKISSMLDALDDIGNVYEDLVTVSLEQTNNVNFEQIKTEIDKVENILKSNEDIEMVYPSKIFNFAKEYYEKASYINETEENEMKEGLVTSKILHSKFLTNWADEFIQIYINKYLVQNPVTISYSQEELTNENVKAVLESNDNILVLNNSNSNEYIFEQNGKFVFQYERRGHTLEAEVKVENIDKEKPKITGVEKGKIYAKAVTPIIEDENLEKIILIIDGQIQENYESGIKLENEGIYRIEAIDKAKNVSVITFEILDNSSKDYILKDKVIQNISILTKKEKIIENLNIKTKYKILRNDIEISDSVIIRTGDVLELEDGNKYTLIVKGDITQNGTAGLTDLVQLRKYILKDIELNDNQTMAADIDLDGKVTIKDILKIRKMILER